MDLRAHLALAPRWFDHVRFSLAVRSLREPTPPPPPAGLEVRPAGLGVELSFYERAIDGDLAPRVHAIGEAICIMEGIAGDLELTDAELDHLADVGADATDRGLYDDELLAVLTAAADQITAARPERRF